MTVDQFTPEQRAALRQEFTQLEGADIRRIWFFSAGTLTGLYLFADLLLRWGYRRGNATAIWLTDVVASNQLWLTLVFILSAGLVGLFFHSIDFLFETDDTSLLRYSLTSITHIRPIAVVVLTLFGIADIFVLYYALFAPSYWLLSHLWKLTLAVCMVTDWPAFLRNFDVAQRRFRLAARRIPLIGRLVRVQAPPVPPAAAPVGNTVTAPTSTPVMVFSLAPEDPSEQPPPAPATPPSPAPATPPPPAPAGLVPGPNTNPSEAPLHIRPSTQAPEATPTPPSTRQQDSGDGTLVIHSSSRSEEGDN